VSFVETFVAVFTAQLLAFFASDLIQRYVKPRWDRAHDRLKARVDVVKGWWR
jgi:hypothetical protein